MACQAWRPKTGTARVVGPPTNVIMANPLWRLLQRLVDTVLIKHVSIRAAIEDVVWKILPPVAHLFNEVEAAIGIQSLFTVQLPSEHVWQ